MRTSIMLSLSFLLKAPLDRELTSISILLRLRVQNYPDQDQPSVQLPPFPLSGSPTLPQTHYRRILQASLIAAFSKYI